MIDTKIIKIASDTRFVGLKNEYTHKSSIKNSLCGDYIKIELIVKNKKVKSMRYETESCILCEASASLLANKLKNFDIKHLKKEILIFKKIKKYKKNKFPIKFKEFEQLLNKKTNSRLNCVILPIEALFKAFKISE